MCVLWRCLSFSKCVSHAELFEFCGDVVLHMIFSCAEVLSFAEMEFCGDV